MARISFAIRWLGEGVLLLLLGVLVGCSGEQSVGSEEDSLSPRAVTGDLSARVDAVQDAMPRRGEEGFDPPSDTELTHWRDLVGALVEKDTTTARSLAADHAPSYQVISFTDTTSRQTYFLLQEVPTVERGWGSVVVNPDPVRHLAVEVPHPVFDLDTYQQGVDLFLQSGARLLLMAGTHRCSNQAPSPCDGQTSVCNDGQYHISDMAHVVEAPFQVTHEVMTNQWPKITSLSLHGNGNDDCETVFLSGGVPEESSPVIDDLAQALDNRGVEVGVPGASACPLVGSTNVQGRYTNGASTPCTDAASETEGRFIHVEQRRSFRESSAKYERLIQSVNATFDPLH